MNKSIRIENLINLLITIVSILFATTSILINYIIPSSMIRNIILLIAIFVMLISIFYNKKITWTVIMIIPLLLISIVHNQGPLQKILTYLFSIVICCFLEKKIDVSYQYLKWSKIIYLIYALLTIIFLFTPDLYLNHIVNLFPDTKDRLIDWYSHGYMPGLTFHYSTNGMFLSAGLLIVFSQYLIFKNNKKKNLLLILLFIIALLMTGKRGHIIFSAISIYFVYYLYLSNNKRSRTVKTFGIIILVLCIGYLLIDMFPALGAFIKRFQETLEAGDVTSTRIKFWELSISLFKEHSIIGVGWNQFQEYSTAILNYRAHTHNIYLQLLCETGIVGFITYIFWFTVCLYKTIKVFIFTRKQNLINEKEMYLLAYSTSFQIFFLLYGITGNPLYDSEMYIPYFISCGIGLHFYLLLKKKNKGEKNEKSKKEQE